MKKEDYENKKKELEKEYETKKSVLMREFVDSNNPYKIGDIVTDHIGSVRIERIKYTWGYYNVPPGAVYYGIELLKNGTPNKRGTMRDVYQSNLIK